ncbi:hypothetical protein C5E10_11685 [Pseudoclavibacter sp. RFBG4]|nr:hypothetical protein C5E10_11685 [Pseudoclavibacter sp. RFBG4]
MNVALTEAALFRCGSDTLSQSRILSERLAERFIKLPKVGFSFNATLENDGETVQITVTFTVTEPGVNDINTCLPRREYAQVLTSRFHLNVPRGFGLNRDIFEPLRNECFGFKIASDQSSSKPSRDRVLEIKTSARPSSASRSAPFINEAS